MWVPFFTVYRERKRQAQKLWHLCEHNCKSEWQRWIEKMVLDASGDRKDIREKHGKTLYKLHNGFKQLFTWRNEAEEVLDAITDIQLHASLEAKAVQGAVTRLLRAQERHLTTHIREAEIRAALLNYLHVEMVPGEGSEPPFAQCKQGPTPKEILAPVSAPNSGGIIPD